MQVQLQRRLLHFESSAEERRLKNIWFHSFNVPSTHHVYYPTWMYNVCDAILNNKMNQCWISWIYYHRIASILFATWKCIFSSSLCCLRCSFNKKKLDCIIDERCIQRSSSLPAYVAPHESSKEKTISISPKNFHLYGYTTGRIMKNSKSWWVGAETYSRDQIRCGLNTIKKKCETRRDETRCENYSRFKIDFQSKSVFSSYTQ